MASSDVHAHHLRRAPARRSGPRAGRRLRRRQHRPGPRAPSRPAPGRGGLAGQRGELHALHAAAARGLLRRARAAPRRDAAARDGAPRLHLVHHRNRRGDRPGRTGGDRHGRRRRAAPPALRHPRPGAGRRDGHVRDPGARRARARPEDAGRRVQPAQPADRDARAGGARGRSRRAGRPADVRRRRCRLLRRRDGRRDRGLPAPRAATVLPGGRRWRGHRLPRRAQGRRASGDATGHGRLRCATPRQAGLPHPARDRHQGGHRGCGHRRR